MKPKQLFGLSELYAACVFGVGLLLALAAIQAFGQDAPSGVSPKPAAAASAPAPAPVPADDEVTAYLLSDTLKLKVRDGQIEWDELEIENQKLLVKIEQNKARQKDLTDGIRIVMYRFAQDKKIDLNAWEIDAKELKFRKKKATAK